MHGYIAYEKATNKNIRNRVIEELNDLWGNVYQEIATCKISGDEILRVTATLYHGDDSGKPQKATKALKSLIDSCSNSEDTINTTRKIYEVAKKLIELKTNVHLGPVNDILQARVLAVAISLSDTISKEEKVKVLKQWEKVTFRIYSIFGKDSRSKVGDYIRLANKIMNKSKSRYSEIMTAIRKIGEDHPIEAAINEGLRNKNVYADNQEVVRYILWKYEEKLAKQVGNTSFINEEFKNSIWERRSATDSIEHIIPQNPEPGGAWDGKYDNEKDFKIIINNIGNLILLPQPLNAEAKRQGFGAKKEVYKKSEGLRMIQEIMDEDDWSQEKILIREEKILEWVAQEWNDISD